MIVEFSVENYRSIAERQTLSFVASKHRSDAAGAPAIEHDGFPHKLLTSVVVYGANASGKSNLLHAFHDFRERIRLSATETRHEIEPFRLGTSHRPTRFEITFLREGVRYQYGFALNEDLVEEEWLLAYPSRSAQLWFERGAAKEPRFGGHLKGEKRRIYTLTRPDALYLSVAAQLNHEQLGAVHRWLLDNLQVVQAQYTSAVSTAEVMSGDPELSAALTRMLKVADLGIDHVVIRHHENMPEASSRAGHEPRSVIEAGKDSYLEVRTAHRRDDGSYVEFDLFAQESAGTIRYFAMLAPLLGKLGKGGLLAVDELDDHLHPLLVRTIISWFHDPKLNTAGAQLLFNTHDTTLLDPALFRRDQVWFTEKDRTGRTKLYSLLEFSPRKKEALQKGYLEGRYGAIPFLGELRFEHASPGEAEAAE